MSPATRRTVVAAVAAALAVPLAAATKPSGGLRRLGVLMVGTSSDPEGQRRAAALIEGLAKRDWHENSNLLIEWRWAHGDPALFERYAEELVALGPEVLVAAGSLSAKVLQRRSKTTPVVFVHVTDPVGQGFIASIPHPGGNITGFTIYDPPMAGKWLQLLMQIAPPLRQVGVLFNPDTTPYAGLYLRVLQDIAPAAGITMHAATCHDDAGIDAAIAQLAAARGGLIVLPNTF